MSNTKTINHDKESQLDAIDVLRLEATSQLDPARRVELGQFMTSTPLAEFMASLFSQDSGPIRLLEAGAGVGSLIAAFLGKWGTTNCSVYAYEIDSYLSSRLSGTLAK